jgi:hypothetical protein
MPALLDQYVARLKLAFPEFRAFGDGDAALAAQERDYKLELCALFAESVESSLRALPPELVQRSEIGDRIVGLFTKRLTAGQPQNLVGWRYFQPLTKLDASGRARLAAITADLLYGSGGIADRVDRFVPDLRALVGDGIPAWAAMSRSVTTFLLMLSDPKNHAIVKTQEFKRAMRAYDGTSLPNRPLTGHDYQEIQTFLFRVRDEMVADGLSPRDLIDVQTLIWVGDPDYGKASEPSESDNDDLVISQLREQITADDILQAIAALDRGEPHAFGPSTFYDVLFQDRRYPPKAVVGIAAKRVLGRPLKPDEFSGGENQWAFRLLRARGFEVVRKEAPPDSTLPAVPSVAVWIEDTKSDHQHGGEGWEFGKCLWSPSTYENGTDRYALMREPKTGDLVIHINDSVLAGWSHVARAFVESTTQPPKPGAWGGREMYYRIELNGYREFAKPVSLTDFISENTGGLEKELRADPPPRYFPFILYQERVRHAQGIYLGRCTRGLYDLIRKAVQPEAHSAAIPGSRFWAMGLGEGGRLWDECQEKGIAVIGWDEYGLGDLRNYPSRDSILDVLIQKRAAAGPAPTNAALCLYQFSHEMAEGDYIIAKAGRLRILGIGRVTSDYFLDQERSEYQHCRRVKWISASGLELPKHLALATKTLTDVTPYSELVSLIKETYFQQEPEAPLREARPYAVNDALQTLYLSRQTIDEVIEALTRKKNVILQGPPGVGKTFAARRIAYLLLREIDDTRIEFVQFHQSYAYEDFVQGWRPQAQGGFRIKNGIFLEFCNRARIDPERKYVFIIDEINRANLSKAFGELLMLIEADKRGAKFSIPLTYSDTAGDRFSVPENLYIIGLMNTADRSLALIDYALRRRFTFFMLRPALDSDLFRQELLDAGATDVLVGEIRSRMKALNELIVGDPNLGEGYQIGHSYFCGAGAAIGHGEVNFDWYRRVVATEIVPQLKEYWFDKRATEIEAITSGLTKGLPE